MASMDNWERDTEDEAALCARCRRAIQEVKCSADNHGPNLCRFECPYCGFVNSGAALQCMREIHLKFDISRRASEIVSLPDEVKILVGEIVINYALAENLFSLLLPEQYRGTIPHFSNDKKTMQRLLSKMGLPHRNAIQQVISLSEDISHTRHNLAHGRTDLRTYIELDLYSEEDKNNQSGGTLPPAMVRPRDQDEIGRTELSYEALEPYASKCRELVSLISRTRVQLPDEWYETE